MILWPIAKWNAMLMEFAVLKIMKRNYISEKKPLIFNTEQNIFTYI